MVDQKVGVYWWFKTPRMNLTWPVLRTKECAESTQVKILNVQPAVLPLMSFSNISISLNIRLCRILNH